MGASIHRLPGPCVAAAADGDTVWCVARDRLVAFDAPGTQRRDAPIGAGVRSLAASGQMLVAVVEPGVIVWLDPESGTATQRRPVGGTPVLVAGGGAVWAVDVGSGRAWRVADAGAVLGPTIVADVDRAAADGERLWWTSKRDAFLREGARTVDLGVRRKERGGLAVCAGSVWTSVAKGLLRVGAWKAELGTVVAAPAGPVPFLVCGAGVLVGGSRDGLFALDPSVDADARRLDADVGGDVGFLVAVRSAAWVFSRRRAQARRIALRAG